MNIKIKLLCAFLICFRFQESKAQLTLENIFGWEAVFRVNLEYDGEKYVTYLPDSHKIKLYNIDHVLWKEFNFYLPQNAEYDIYNVSQALVNNDSLIEVTFGYRFNTYTPFLAQIVSENGDVLFTIDEIMSGYSYHQNPLELLSFQKLGNETKLIANVYSSANPGFYVYSLPQLQLEHIYKGLGLVKLESAGTKYVEVTYDIITRDYTLNLYNLNHTLYKSTLINIEDNVPSNNQNVWHALHIIDISESKVNQNAEIEICLSLDYSDTQGVLVNNLVIIYDEFGNVLNQAIEVGSSGTAAIIKKSNEFNLLCFTSNSIGYPGAPNSVTVNRLSLPSFQNLQTYTHTVSPIVLEGLGTKFYEVNFQTGLLNFYNIDYSTFKTIQLPLTPNTVNPNFEIFKIGTTYFDDDTLIEILYNFRSIDNGIYSNVGHIYKEGTGIILDIEGCSYITIDSTLGLQHKIIASISSPVANSYFGTNVYHWPGGVNRLLGMQTISNTINENNRLLIYPNPVKEKLFFGNNSLKEHAKVEIFNALGNKIKEETSNQKFIELENLMPGFYLIKINNKVGKFIKQ